MNVPQRPQSSQQPPLLRLPEELRLMISVCLIGTVKQLNPQRNLCNLALTCKALLPCSREALSIAPILPAKNVNLLLGQLFLYPALRLKTRVLTVESDEPRDESERDVLAIEDQKVYLCQRMVAACIKEISNSRADPRTKSAWITALRAGVFKNSALLLPLLVVMLPKLQELYLGGTALFNFPIFRDMLPELDNSYTFRHIRENHGMADWNTPNLSRVVPFFGHKLRVLEWPYDLRFTEELNPQMMTNVRRISKFFPRLRKLIIPAGAISTTAPSRHIIPSKLEALILTRAQVEHNQWLMDLLEDSAKFPCLQRLEVYYLEKQSPYGQAFRDIIRYAGIHYFEFNPECCFRCWEMAKHPWMYTPDEINLVEKVLHGVRH